MTRVHALAEHSARLAEMYRSAVAVGEALDDRDPEREAELLDAIVKHARWLKRMRRVPARISVFEDTYPYRRLL